MPLPSGMKLGPYELISLIGAGGMGEVYRASDSRLGREVAVKILPSSFAHESDRLQRFDREARAVGAMNHPNILSVYDVGVQDSTSYIVTELLDGETLRDRLRIGALPIRRAIDYAIQIAKGLAAAHEKGFVHRDLKPENLFVTKDGRVKILDFGLAKHSITSLSQGEGPTVGSVHTLDGIVLGTIGYMSPEQVRGEPSDHRSDIFAFGTVLYEMLTGQRAFHRNSSVETMNAILKEEPAELVGTGSQISPALQRMVQRCLEKDASERFQSAKDLGFSLESLSGVTSGLQTVPSTPAARRLRWTVALALITLCLVVTVLATRALWPRAQQPEHRQITFRQGYIPAARFAPDAQSIIFGAAWDQPSIKLYSSRLEGTEARRLELPPAELLSVSHSGELAIAIQGKTWLGVGARLARTPVDGGAPRELLDDVIAADWSPDGQLAVARFHNGKCEVEFPVGKPLYQTIGWISHMRFSPQGDAIAFMDHPITGDDRGSVVLVDITGNKHKLTQEWSGEQGLAWFPDGREVWFTATRGVDVDRPIYGVTRSGKLRMVVRVPGGLYLEDIASDGRVLLKHDERRYEVTAAQVGGETRQLSWQEIMIAASLSGDGKFAIMTDESGTSYGVYIRKLDGSPPILLGTGIAGGISPDDRYVTSIPANDTSKVMLLPTSVGDTKTITGTNFRYRTAVWTSDGTNLVVRASESDGPVRFWLQDITGGAPRPITPAGVDGVFVTINHSDYVSARDSTGTLRLYRIYGGEPKIVPGIGSHEQVIGGSSDSDVLYVTPDDTAVPMQIFKVNVTNGSRRPFISVEPKDQTGVVALMPPLFTRDEKQYIYTQVRDFSVLYVAFGLK